MKSTKVNNKRMNKNKHTRNVKGGSKDMNLNPIFRKYKLNAKERSTIFLKMSELSKDFFKNVDNNTYIDKYFREPKLLMYFTIMHFLQNKSIVDKDIIPDLSADLYHFFYNLLMKKSKHFRSLSKSQTLSESLGSSTNDLSIASVLSNKDTITFRKISSEEVTQDIPLYTIV